MAAPAERSSHELRLWARRFCAAGVVGLVLGSVFSALMVMGVQSGNEILVYASVVTMILSFMAMIGGPFGWLYLRGSASDKDARDNDARDYDTMIHELDILRANRYNQNHA